MNKLKRQDSSQRHNRQTRSDQPLFSHLLSRGAAAIIVVTSLAIVTTPASARWYKWVDESGNISYQDRPPPANYEQSAEVLNENGVTVETIPSKQQQLEIDRKARLDAEQRQRDEALIKAFPTENDLVNTRNKRVTHIDGAVARMHDQLVILNNRLVSIEERVAVRVDRKLEPSQALESDRIAVIRSIDSTNALIKSKLRERRLVVSQFDRDLIRYRDLKATTATASFGE